MEKNTKFEEIKEAIWDSPLYLHDSIDRLSFSVRLANALHRNGIETVDDVLHCSIEKLSHFRNVSQKSMDEFRFCQKQLQKFFSIANKNSDENQISEVGDNKSITRNSLLQMGINNHNKNITTQARVYLGTSINTLSMSTRLSNLLQRNGIRTIEDILQCPGDSLTNLRGMGQKTIAEFIYYQNKLSKNLSQMVYSRPCLFADTLRTFTGDALGSKILRDVTSVDGTKEQIGQLWKNIDFINFVQHYFLLKMGAIININHNGEFSLETLHNLIPSEFYSDDGFSAIISRLSHDQGLIEDKTCHKIRFLSLSEFVDSISNPRDRKAVQLRLAGAKLGEIGEVIHVTRERARQIILKTLKDKPMLEEDLLLPLWKKYKNLSSSDYMTIFGWPRERVIYLQIISGIRKAKVMHSYLRDLDLKRVQEDFSTDETVMERMQAINKDISPRVVLLGKQIPKDKYHLVKFAASVFCQKSIRYAKFLQKYQDFLSELGLENDESLFIADKKSFQELLDADFLIWGHGKYMRYYDGSAINVETFFDDAQLYDYVDVNVFAFRIFCDHRNIMKKYDIRNESELYNLLQRLWTRKPLSKFMNPHHRLSFKRDRVITFGREEIIQRMWKLLEDSEPVYEYRLANKYCQKYGGDMEEVMDEYQLNFSKYLSHGVYSVDKKKRGRKC